MILTFIIRETYYLKTHLFKYLRTSNIILHLLFFTMIPTIDLNHQLRLQTTKISNKIKDDMLTLETESRRSTHQQAPQTILCRSHVESILTSE